MRVYVCVFSNTLVSFFSRVFNELPRLLAWLLASPRPLFLLDSNPYVRVTDWLKKKIQERVGQNRRAGFTCVVTPKRVGMGGVWLWLSFVFISFVLCCLGFSFVFIFLVGIGRIYGSSSAQQYNWTLNNKKTHKENWSRADKHTTIFADREKEITQTSYVFAGHPRRNQRRRQSDILNWQFCAKQDFFLGGGIPEQVGLLACLSACLCWTPTYVCVS